MRSFSGGCFRDVELPETMRRAMARQAESERDRRAKVIHALGRVRGGGEPRSRGRGSRGAPRSDAAAVLATMSEVASERNSTLIFPIPVELMRLVYTAREALDGRRA